MESAKKEGLSPSRFYMWRAIFAMAHADGIVTPHEVSFLSESTLNLPLSDSQREMLKRDLAEAQDPATMFTQVTEARDREEFFVLARVLCWSDGDFDVQERKMMNVLEDLDAQQEARALLERSRQVVQEIQLNKDQWVSEHKREEQSIFEKFSSLLKTS